MDTILVKDVKNRVTVNVAEKGATGPAGPASNYTLPPATNATLGGIIVGDNLSITGNGVLSAQPGGVTAFNNRTGNVNLTSNDVTSALTYTPLTSTTPYSNLSFTGTSTASPFNLKVQNSNGSRYASLSSPSAGLVDLSWVINSTRANGQTDTYYPFMRLYTDPLYPDINEGTLYLQYNYTANASSGPYYNTSVRISKNKAEFYAQTYTWTDNSLLTRFYADTRYLTSANLTYANITGTPDLTAYVKKTQNTTQTIASTASIGSDSSTLTMSSSSYGMSVTTLAGTSNLTVTPTAATLVLAGGGTWTSNSILTLGYADGRYLTSANLTYANITGKPTLANVATSGSYTDLSNTPTAYSLPTATNTTLGGIKVGANLSISNGVLSAVSSGSSTTSLPWANITSTPTTLAGYGITDGLTASNLTAYLTSATAASTYLPIANFTYANITGKPTLATVATTGSYTDLSNTPTAYSLPTATTSVLGGVKVDGSSIVINSGVISSTYSYTLPAATVSTLGGVRLGTGVGLDANGFLTTDVKLGANSFTGTQNLQDNELIRAKIRDYSETVSSPTISSGTLVLNLETSNIFTVSLNAAITTLTISNPPASGSGGSFTLIFTADGTARAVTWPAAIKWAGGTAPTLTSTSGKVDSFAFFTSDGGTNWQGYVGGQNF